MRINVYNEELTEEVEIVHVTPNGNHYIGLRFMLESSPKLHDSEDDDDRSAVTFWVGDRIRGIRLLQNAINVLEQGQGSLDKVDDDDEEAERRFTQKITP